MFHLIFIAITSIAASLFANESPQVENQETPSTDVAKISEAFGHFIGKNIDALGVKFDLEYVIRGLQDSLNGKTSPLNETEFVQAFSAAQETTFKKISLENLKKAEDFLTENAKNKEVVTLEEGKLQYKIEKKGKGSEVHPHFSPLIKFVGKYLDGSVFGISEEGTLLPLDETIAGLSKGLVGMKEGEKRVLYIHPDFGYGTSSSMLPNSLLTFEVEIVKANAAEQEAISTSPSKDKASSEIAMPDLDTKALR